ncbi:phosphoribosylglycinamide formyltransferase [Insolitispirillum peregrinum]|uniref:phosphoribosylglycinamide formyltransferase n=1 Tax=Insolitispirillum peregrinum TaxID=80876 RepID=UPI0036173E80
MSTAPRLKVGVLVSGRGSNLQALLDACKDPAFPAEIVHVLSNKADAYGLVLAKQAGISTTVISHKDFPDRESFDAAMDRALRAAGVGFVCLAGFMRLLSEGFVQGWQDRMINIHPSLLPSYKGLHTHERVLADGGKLHGCSVHFVRPACDEGPLIAQAAVPVLDDDTADSLAARVLEQEHRIYPLALRLIADGKVRVVGNRALTDGCTASGALVVPDA